MSSVQSSKSKKKNKFHFRIFGLVIQSSVFKNTGRHNIVLVCQLCLVSITTTCYYKRNHCGKCWNINGPNHDFCYSVKQNKQNMHHKCLILDLLNDVFNRLHIKHISCFNVTFLTFFKTILSLFYIYILHFLIGMCHKIRSCGSLTFVSF